MDTITHIREELQARRGDWPEICRSTNLSYWWLTKFAQGRIGEPGLSKIERLQAYVAAHPLPGKPEAAKVAPRGEAA